MEGKLFKMVEGYTLSLTGSIDDLYGISDKQLAEDHQLHKLSHKNCQAIENGYDLDELASSLVDRETTASVDSSYRKTLEKYVKIGFQKALEILGDKKFSVDGLIDFYIEKTGYGMDMWSKEENNILSIVADYIQSLQPTEWDVEIEMECPQCKEWGYISECRNNCNQKFLQPKLDADGCLILKRK